MPILDPQAAHVASGTGSRRGGGKTKPAGPRDAEVEEYARQLGIGDVVRDARERANWGVVRDPREVCDQSADRTGRWRLRFLTVCLVKESIDRNPAIEAHPGLAVVLPEVFALQPEGRPAALQSWADRAPHRDLLAAAFAVAVEREWGNEAARNALLSTLTNASWERYREQARKRLQERPRGGGKEDEDGDEG
jgi:hypothetical protein